MNPWNLIPAKNITPEDFFAIIEISKGSKQKYEADPLTGLLYLDRILYTSTHYPANYGFIPRTLSKDGDPIDVLVLSSEVLVPMCMVQCYPIGMISMTDDDKIDEKILAVPFKDPQMAGYRDLDDIPAHIHDEIMHFFTIYKELEGIKTDVLKIAGRAQAAKAIQVACQAFLDVGK